MVTQKRTFALAAGMLAAALLLSGCADTDYAVGSSDTARLGVAQAAAGGVEDAEEATEEAEDETADESGDEEATEDEESAEVIGKPVGSVTDELTATAVPRMGNVVTDAEGWVLYRFDKDKAKPPTSNCVDDCAKLWPPVLADDTLKLSGIAAGQVDTIERADGGLQVTIGGWPVYRYIGDKKPGTWKGQNVGGVWFVVAKDGKKNLTCLPEISKPVALPADESDETEDTATESSTEEDSGSDSDGYASDY